MTKKYGIYSTNGKKLKNSDEILKEYFWPPITKNVLDRINHNFFGILFHKVYVDGKLHWIVREANKQHFKYAPMWYKKDKYV